MKKILCVLMCILLGLSVFTVSADSGISVTASSSFASRVIECAFDGDESTYWHSEYKAEGSQITWKAECPHIITVDFIEEKTMNGWRYVPRNNNMAGVFTKYTLYSSKDSINYNKIIDGTFEYPDGYKPVSAKFDKVTTRYIKLEVTEAIEGFGTAAEIQFLLDDVDILRGKKVSQTSSTSSSSNADEITGTAITGVSYLSRKNWKAEGESFVANPLTKAIDGNEKSFWHSCYNAENGVVTERKDPPFELTFILPEATLVSGFSLLPRSDMDVGRITKAELYGSDSDTGEFIRLTDTLPFNNDVYSKDVELTANVKLKRIKLVILDATAHFGTLAEFNAWSEDSEKATVDLDGYYEYSKTTMSYKVDYTGISATYDGECWGANTADKVADGLNTIWQTEEVKEFPVILNVDLGKVYELEKVVYTPRQTPDFHGCWLSVSIGISKDGEVWEQAVAEKKLEKSLARKTIDFPEPKEARYVEFIIEEAYSWRASCAELDFYQTADSYFENSTVKTEKYVIQVNSDIMQWEKTEGTESTKGEEKLSASPFIVDGTTMVPLRGILEKMGAEVSWDGDTRSITVENEDKMVTLQVFNVLVYVNDRKLGNIMYTLLNYPVIKDSRTFVPLRFLSEQMGYDVVWDGEEQKVTITKEIN